MQQVPSTIQAAAVALRRRELTSTDLTKAVLERADRIDPIIGANITRMDESALQAAARADAAFELGIDKGPLQGIPIGLKDILSTDDAPTTGQSLTMDRTWSGQGDGPVVARLRRAGAVIVAKNSTMEFACGLPDPDKPFPVPRNPWNPDRWTGGSSSGTAAAVAAGMLLGGVGTDTGGSVRIPAAYCGVTGLKQTFGRVPKSGCTQNGFSLDHVGPLARSAWDCAAMLEVMAGHDPVDPNSSQRPVEKWTEALDGDISALRIAVLRDQHTRDVDGVPSETVERFEDAVSVLGSIGAKTDDVVIPHYRVFQTANWINNSSEKSGIYAKRFASQWEDWGRYTRMAGGGSGLFFTAADYVQALRVRRYAQSVVSELMLTYDVLVSPTTKTAATPLADIGYSRNGGFGFAAYTGVWSFLGLPALAAPMGFTDDSMPLSLQIVGRPFDEATVLKVGDAYQRHTDWHLRVPPVASTQKEPAAWTTSP